MVKMTLNGSRNGAVSPSQEGDPDFRTGKLPDFTLAAAEHRLLAAVSEADRPTKLFVRDQIHSIRKALEALKHGIGETAIREGMTIDGEAGRIEIAKIEKSGALRVTVQHWERGEPHGMRNGESVTLTHDGNSWRSKIFTYPEEKGKFQLVISNFDGDKPHAPEAFVERIGRGSKG